MIWLVTGEHRWGSVIVSLGQVSVDVSLPIVGERW